ncbi:hypothetical protein [Candidatus Magnetaquicoccus inordinatus]|uniref:hypothetical protein n=1 Tax=Candidatus Magnetaquicoccus inordinatus TaxID=2496818 RepID=UPI00187D4927|nr:hypothetical protein [Candidatus Magnetaquicoccus inordinatus]
MLYSLSLFSVACNADKRHFTCWWYTRLNTLALFLVALAGRETVESLVAVVEPFAVALAGRETVESQVDAGALFGGVGSGNLDGLLGIHLFCVFLGLV